MQGKRPGKRGGCFASFIRFPCGCATLESQRDNLAGQGYHHGIGQYAVESYDNRDNNTINAT
jgi:hypothetical protein